MNVLNTAELYNWKLMKWTDVMWTVKYYNRLLKNIGLGLQRSRKNMTYGKEKNKSIETDPEMKNNRFKGK